MRVGEHDVRNLAEDEFAHIPRFLSSSGLTRVLRITVFHNLSIWNSMCMLMVKALKSSQLAEEIWSKADEMLHGLFEVRMLVLKYPAQIDHSHLRATLDAKGHSNGNMLSCLLNTYGYQKIP